MKNILYDLSPLPICIDFETTFLNVHVHEKKRPDLVIYTKQVDNSSMVDFIQCQII